MKAKKQYSEDTFEFRRNWNSRYRESEKMSTVEKKKKTLEKICLQ